MLKITLRKVASVVMCASLVATLQLPTLAFADEPEGGEEAASQASAIVGADFRSQSLADMYSANDLTVEGGAEATVDSDKGLLLLEAGRTEMLASTISISKSFDFGEKSVGRFNVTGLAAKGKKVVLAFYLDGSTTPFATLQLKNQPVANDWSHPQMVSADVVDQGITGSHTLSIKVEACSVSPEFALESIEFSQASIPVLNINIDESLGSIQNMNNSEKHTVNCYGTMSISVPEGCTSAMTGKALSGTEEALDLEYIRGRGNSTWTADKKPYRLKLDKSADLLGMGKSKHWALMAHAYDESGLRNVFSSLLGQELGMDYTYSMEPVELVMNGNYLGTYCLSEVTRVEKKPRRDCRSG